MFTEKSILFKLLSEENIQVVFAKAHTASFDTEKRILTIPTFAFLSDDELNEFIKSAILDLFGGHEVGHALYTPHATIDQIKSWGVPFAFVNIVEDVRIERFVKNRYPGLKPAFYNAYRYLFKQGFFGVDADNVNTLGFADRLNIFAKVGVAANISFSKEEEVLVREAMTTTTFSEVIELAKKIYKFAKQPERENKKENKKEENTDNSPYPDEDDLNESPDALTLSEGDGDDESDESNEPGTSDSSDEGEEDEGEEIEVNSSGNGGETDNEDATELSDNTSEKGDEASDSNMPNTSDEKTDKEIEPVTQDNFDSKLSKEADKAPKIQQLTLRINNPKSFITSFKKVLADDRILSVYKVLYYDPLRVDNYNTWMSNNNKVVNYLVKEFEMKKAATAYRNSMVSNSGLLNNKKLFAYKLTDDLFKKITSIPDGQNHSLTILVDWSGSMESYASNVLRQAITIANFCRKAQIPFNIFLFTHEYRAQPEKTIADNECAPHKATTLINIFNNQMTNSEFTLMSKILFGNISVGLLRRGYTPLDSALLITKEIIKETINTNKTEKNTLIVLSDGSDTEKLNYNWHATYDSRGNNYIINPTNNMSYWYNFNGGSTESTFSIMKLLKDELHINIMWLFLANSLRSPDVIRFRTTYATRELSKEFSKEGFINHNANNIDVCQIINNKTLDKINNIGVVSSKKASTKSQLKSEFSKMMNSSLVNKTLLNQWIKVFNV